MKALFKGIFRNFSSSSGATRKAIYTDLGGKLYLGAAPPGTTFPYGTYHLISNSHEWQMQSDYEDATIQIDLFVAAAKATTVMNYYDDLNTAFDNQPLTCTGYGFVQCNRTFGHLQKFDDVIPGKSVWQYSVEYDIYLKKS